jgi:hypothetical protein
LPTAQWDDDVEGQVTVYDGVVVSRLYPIRLNPSDSRGSHVTLPPTLAARLAIDDPVAERPPGLRQVAVGKVIATGDVVVVTRPRSCVEDRFQLAR